MTNTQAQVVKLEAAMHAVGEGDPTEQALEEALKKARNQAQAQPFKDRIVAKEFFLGRSRKRTFGFPEEAEKEKDLIPAVEDRLHADRQEENGAAPESPPQTVLCQFCSADVVVTWNCARAPAGGGRAAVCACWADKRSGKDLASMMETLMDQAESAVSSREQTAGLKFLTALVLPAITQGLPPLGPSQSEAAVLRHLFLAFLHLSFRKHRWFL